MTSVLSKKSKRTNIDKIIEEQQAEIDRVKKIDDYLEKNNKGSSPRQNMIQKYFESVKEEGKKKNNDEENDNKLLVPKLLGEFREKRNSLGYISLGKLSDKPLKSTPKYHNVASEIRKQQMHKTYDIILNREADDVPEDDWRFIRKQNLEYPNYDQKLTEQQLDLYNQFNFKKKPNIETEPKETPHKNKDLSNYLKTLFSNKDEIKIIVQLMRDLIEASVDYRVLYILRENLIKNKQEYNAEYVSVDDFRKLWQTLMNQEKHEQNPHIELRLLHIVTDDTGKKIDMQKLSNIVDLSEFYPMIVKKDKNFSQELYYILSSGTAKDYEQVLEQSRQNNIKTIDELRTEQVCEFIWTKIEEKYKNLADAFRFFDANNNTMVTRKEFRDGLERLKIKVTDEDRELVFNFLDKNKNG